MKDERPRGGSDIYGVPAAGSLWLLIPRLALSILTSTVFIFAIFWLQFGEVNTFPFLLSCIAGGFQILLVIGLRHRGRFRAVPLRERNRILDTIGAFWLIAVIFGAVAAWFTSDLAQSSPAKALPLHLATVMFAIILPIATSVPNYRYVTVANAYITVPMLLIVSLLPSLAGWRSVTALWNSFTN